MATIKFRVRGKENKEVSIYVSLSLGRGKVYETKTDFFVLLSRWSDKTSMPKQGNDEEKKLHNKLSKLRQFISDKLNEDLATENVVINTQWLKAKIKECFGRVSKEDNTLVKNHYQYIIDHASTRKIKGTQNFGLSDSRKKSYINSKRIIIEYEEKIKREIRFMDIDKRFVDAFLVWLQGVKKYSVEHCNKQLTDLKAVCTDAEKIEIKVNPYCKFIEGFRENDEDRHIVTLSFDELEQIKNIDLEREALVNARKWLLIGCEIGQRGGDLLKLKPEMIRRGDGSQRFIDVFQSKGKKNVTVGVLDPYIVNLLDEDFPYVLSDQKLRVYVKEICKSAGINEIVEGKKIQDVIIEGKDKPEKRKVLGMYPKCELVSLHSFRRSFATNYYKKVPTAILMSITGHTKESIFLKYINKPEDKDENAKLFMKFWEMLEEEKVK